MRQKNMMSIAEDTMVYSSMISRTRCMLAYIPMVPTPVGFYQWTKAIQDTAREASIQKVPFKVGPKKLPSRPKIVGKEKKIGVIKRAFCRNLFAR